MTHRDGMQVDNHQTNPTSHVLSPFPFVFCLANTCLTLQVIFKNGRNIFSTKMVLVGHISEDDNYWTFTNQLVKKMKTIRLGEKERNSVQGFRSCIIPNSWIMWNECWNLHDQVKSPELWDLSQYSFNGGPLCQCLPDLWSTKSYSGMVSTSLAQKWFNYWGTSESLIIIGIEWV